MAAEQRSPHLHFPASLQMPLTCGRDKVEQCRTRQCKLAREEDAQETGAIKAAVRSAKKTQRPAKIGEKQTQLESSKQRSRDKARKKQKVTAGKSSSVFDKDLGQRPRASGATGGAANREGVRAKKGDKIGGMGKKGGGKRKGK